MTVTELQHTDLLFDQSFQLDGSATEVQPALELATVTASPNQRVLIPVTDTLIGDALPPKTDRLVPQLNARTMAVITPS